MLHSMIRTGAVVAGLAFGLASAHADSLADANTFVEKYASKVDKWDGPTTAPKIAKGKTIVVLASDMKNGGVLGVTKGIEEAAKAAGWSVRTLDGAGSVSGRTAAFGQAMTLKPDGLVICGLRAHV